MLDFEFPEAQENFNLTLIIKEINKFMPFSRDKHEAFAAFKKELDNVLQSNSSEKIRKIKFIHD